MKEAENPHMDLNNAVFKKNKKQMKMCSGGSEKTETPAATNFQENSSLLTF